MAGTTPPALQAGDEIRREHAPDLLRRRGSGGVEPSRDPVHGAQDREGQELRVARGEGAGVHPFLQQAADPAVEAIALRDDAAQQGRGEGLEVQGHGRPTEVVQDVVHERLDEAPQLPWRRASGRLDLLEHLEEDVEGVVVTEEEDLFLVLEVVVQAALGHAQGLGDLAHAGPVVAAAPEGRGRALQDLDAALAGLALLHEGAGR